MSTPEPRKVLVEFPTDFDWRVPASLIRVYNADNGKQILTIRELQLTFNAEDLASVRAEFIGGEVEELQLAGVRIQ